VFSDQNETTNVSTATATAVATWTFPIFRSSPATNFILSVANFYDTNGCPGDTNAFPTFTVAVNTNATANLTVEDSSSTCTGVTNHIDVDLGGVAPWTIVWSDGITNKAIATTPFVRDVVFTNNTLTPITNTYSITYVSDKYSTNTDTNILSDVATIVVDPTPPGPPISLGDQVSCFDVAVSLGVTVAPGFTADWYTDVTLTNQVASGTTNFVPTVPVDLQSNSSVTNTYYVVERFPDDALLNPCWSSPTNVTLISTSCVQTVTLSKTKTNILTSFSGNYILQSTTNLTPPQTWTDTATGTPGVLTIITNAAPPAATTNSEFFRLRVPQTLP